MARVQHNNSIERKLRKDFVFFTAYMFRKMGLPDPTPMQKLMCDILQKRPSRRMVILAYRGFAKSTIANLYLIWELLGDPTRQQAVWGQNETFACDSVGQMLAWIQNTPELASLRPLPNQKQSTEGFDTPAKPGHVRGPSVNALSIGGSITGSRADTLLIDDPETIHNGYTQQRRENLDRAMGEAVQVIKQTTGRIIVLGTPHFDRSLYTRLKAKGYRIFILPISVPPEDVANACWEHYPKQIRDAITAGEEGDPLDRMPREVIAERIAEGKISYERQNLCNIYRSKNTDRPLDISRIILYDANPRSLPTSLEHAREPAYEDREITEYSCADVGDKFYRPFRVSETLKGYDDRIVWVDPAGQGKDELVYISAGASSGYMVVFKLEGLLGGVTPDNITRIIDHAIEIRATAIYVESNLNTTAEWIRAVMDEKYAPRFGRTNLPMIVPVHNQINKSLRIQVLDPVINSGRMVITPEALVSDFTSAQDRGVEHYQDYTLTAQISNFSPNSELPFDDRIDALAGCAEKLSAHLKITPAKLVMDERYEYFNDLIKRAFEVGNGHSIEPAIERLNVNTDVASWRKNQVRFRTGRGHNQK